MFFSIDAEGCQGMPCCQEHRGLSPPQSIDATVLELPHGDPHRSPTDPGTFRGGVRWRSGSAWVGVKPWEGVRVTLALKTSVSLAR